MKKRKRKKKKRKKKKKKKIHPKHADWGFYD